MWLSRARSAHDGTISNDALKKNKASILFCIAAMEEVNSLVSDLRDALPDAGVIVTKLDRIPRFGLFSSIMRRPRVFAVGTVIGSSGSSDSDDVASYRVVEITVPMHSARVARAAAVAVFLCACTALGGNGVGSLPTLPSMSPRYSPRQSKKKEKKTMFFISDAWAQLQPHQRHEKTPKNQRRCDQKRLNRAMQRCDQRRGTPPNGAPLVHRTARVRR